MDLLSRAIRGDTDAFEGLVLQYEKLIYNIAFRMMGNAEDAKDISQEVIIKIYRNLSSCAGMEYMKAWTAKITHNTCIDELRRRKGKITDSYDYAAGAEFGEEAPERQFADPADGPEALLLRKELGAIIEEGLRRLPCQHRGLIVLRDIQGMSYEEIAEITSTPMGTVKSRLSRARNSLRGILTDLMEQK